MATTERLSPAHMPTPYYAVIFTLQRTGQDAFGYTIAAARVLELAETTGR